MGRFAPLALVATLLSAADAHALALTLDGVSGEWSNAVGAPATFLTVGDEAQVRWGLDAGFGQSGLGFSGNAAVPLDLIPSVEFEIGTLRHFNNPVFPPTVTSVDLTLQLAFHDFVGSDTFAFTFQITETPNTPPCPFPSLTPCSDRIAFPGAFPSETFAFAGREVLLEIIGFRTTPGGPIVSEFISEEHQTNSAILVARVRVLSGGCVLTQGYWKNHAANWPVGDLELGTNDYTEAQLLAILGQPVKGNGLVSLAHQLIAAKLNRGALAATPDPVEDAIAAADALIGGRLVPPIGADRLSPALTSALESALDAYNNGLSGPPHCQ